MRPSVLVGRQEEEHARLIQLDDFVLLVALEHQAGFDPSTCIQKIKCRMQSLSFNRMQLRDPMM